MHDADPLDPGRQVRVAAGTGGDAFGKFLDEETCEGGVEALDGGLDDFGGLIVETGFQHAVVVCSEGLAEDC